MDLLYFGTQDALSKKEAFHFKKYFKKNSFFTVGEFVIDPAIFTKVNLDCMSCHLVHSSTCCEGGQPYSTDRESEKKLDKAAPFIIQQYLDEKRQREARESGFKEVTATGPLAPTIKLCEGNCFFYVKGDKESYCSIHRYALDHHMSPLELKPMSCSLFPLDVIQMDSELFITAITPETAVFSRWGYEYEEHLCVNMKKREEISSPHFSLKDYRPAWEWCMDLLKQTFGEELIDTISKIKEQRVP
ncbi:DUF3109 family protein [Ammoniphilus sp. 3BR4]|uniref:DUF3109 family protein n=1 Tax=Ammoniphilus sp. 3BR4 TaxID=3158265 RepID=UPI0034677E5D